MRITSSLSNRCFTAGKAYEVNVRSQLKDDLLMEIAYVRLPFVGSVLFSIPDTQSYWNWQVAGSEHIIRLGRVEVILAPHKWFRRRSGSYGQGSNQQAQEVLGGH